jgi:tetratricopeptide (TPR) repeat protein
MRGIGRGVIAAAVWSLCASGAAAQGAELDLEQDARLHFELGQRHFARGELEEAAEEFEQAYRLSHRAPLLYNIFVAHRDAGRDGDAADALRRYLAADPDAPNRARLEVVLRNLEERAARETGAPEPSTEPSAPASSADTSRPASSQGGSVDAGAIALLSTGGVLLAGALVTGVVALTEGNSLEAMCPGDECPESARGLADEVSALSITTDVLWPVGTVLAGIGIAWLIAGATSHSTSSANLNVDLVASQNGAVVSARGSF